MRFNHPIPFEIPEAVWLRLPLPGFGQPRQATSSALTRRDRGWQSRSFRSTTLSRCLATRACRILTQIDFSASSVEFALATPSERHWDGCLQARGNCTTNWSPASTGSTRPPRSVIPTFRWPFGNSSLCRPLSTLRREKSSQSGAFTFPGVESLAEDALWSRRPRLSPWSVPRALARPIRKPWSIPARALIGSQLSRSAIP